MPPSITADAGVLAGVACRSAFVYVHAMHSNTAELMTKYVITIDDDVTAEHRRLRVRSAFPLPLPLPLRNRSARPGQDFDVPIRSMRQLVMANLVHAHRDKPSGRADDRGHRLAPGRAQLGERVGGGGMFGSRGADRRHVPSDTARSMPVSRAPILGALEDDRKAIAMARIPGLSTLSAVARVLNGLAVRPLCTVH